MVYWKRYARINLKLNLLEEAERGYRRSLELGNYELETWVRRCDILIDLGEHEAAVQNLLQATEFYPDTAEIEYRLAGLYFMLQQSRKGHSHLNNALKIDSDFHIIIEELFPSIFARKSVRDKICTHLKSCN